MSFNPLLTQYHTPRVKDLLRNAVSVGSSVAITRTRGGICIGFAEKYIPRGGFDYKHAGTYIDFATAIVRPDDGGPDVAVSLNLGSVKEIADISIRIGDLPHTPFWEGDRIRLKSVSKKADPDGWIISEILYDTVFGKKLGFLYRIKSLKPELCNEKRGDELELIERGNIWKLAHHEPLRFSDIEAEAKFYQSLGMSHKVTHEVIDPQPRGTGYVPPRMTDAWEFKDAICQLRSGQADELKLKDRKNLTYVLIKYEDEEFGERMRAHTLAKFDLTEKLSA